MAIHAVRHRHSFRFDAISSIRTSLYTQFYYISNSLTLSVIVIGYILAHDIYLSLSTEMLEFNCNLLEQILLKASGNVENL